MKPKKVTVENELAERQKTMCDVIIERAMVMMLDEVNAPMAMMLDRLLTFSAAQACAVDGSPNTAKAFRGFADKIDGGLFHSVTGEGKKGH